jgi:hypothetical protein
VTKSVHGFGLAILMALTSSAALAESCRRPEGPRGGKAVACKPSERLRPYEPETARAGREPGFVDLGNGTELRVGGRARLDYDVRR